jgi:hypothetical protein
MNGFVFILMATQKEKQIRQCSQHIRYADCKLDIVYCRVAVACEDLVLVKEQDHSAEKKIGKRLAKTYQQKVKQ